MWKNEARPFFAAIASAESWPKEALWIRGPSGSGKTFGVHELAHEYDIDVIACEYIFRTPKGAKKRQRDDDDNDAANGASSLVLLEQLIMKHRPRPSLVLIDDADALLESAVSLDKALLTLAGRRTALVLVSLDEYDHSATLLELARRRAAPLRIVNARFLDEREQRAIVARAFPTANDIDRCLVPDVRQSLFNAQLGCGTCRSRRDYELRRFDACNVLLGINGEADASARQIERALDDDATTIVFGNAARTTDRDVCAAAFVTEELARFDGGRCDDSATVRPSLLALSLGTARVRAWRRALPGGAHFKLSYGGRALGGTNSKLFGERAAWRHRTLVDVRTDELTTGRRVALERDPAVARTWSVDDCDSFFYRSIIRSGAKFDYDERALARPKRETKLKLVPV